MRRLPLRAGVEITFRPDPSLYDGRYANNGWLQELPKQVTNMSWDNAALMSMDPMGEAELEENEAIELTLNGRKVIAPVLMVPGHPDDAVTVHLGLGRRAEAGRVGAGVGFNAYALRTTDAPLSAGGATIDEAAGTYDLCVTKVHNIEHRGAFAQHDLEKKEFDTEGTYSLAGHEAMERAIIRYATVEEVKKNPNFAHEGASGTLINKVGYNPQGEAPEHDESFFPDAWRYNKTDVSSRQAAEHVGHVDRPELLRGLQCVHRELLCGEQYPGGGPRAGEDRPQHAVAAHRHLLRGRPACTEGALPADGLPALRERGLRAGLPGGRDGAYAGGPEHDGLQPLRGYAILLEQLSVQGAAVQLPAVLGLRHREPEVHAQSGRDGALPRRDGEVQLLRPAHRGGEDRGGQGESRGARRRDRDGVPAGLPDRRDRLRQYQR